MIAGGLFCHPERSEGSKTRNKQSLIALKGGARQFSEEAIISFEDAKS